MPKAGKDPQGGLTAKGRAFFAQKEGSHLRPGVKGAADTPEKLMRKGSFLRRHFTHPRGPMVDDKGHPTRLALSAHAWGEPVPRTMADAKKLADKGHKLLEQYHAGQEKAAAKKGVAKKSPAKKSPAKGAAATKAAAEKSLRSKVAAGKRPAKATKTTATKTSGRKTAATKTAATKTAATRKGAKKRSAKRAAGKLSSR